jgi:hypothetical protein
MIAAVFHRLPRHRCTVVIARVSTKLQVKT